MRVFYPTFWLSCINSLTLPTVQLWPLHHHSHKYLYHLSSTCEQKPIIKKQYIYDRKTRETCTVIPIFVCWNLVLRGVAILIKHLLCCIVASSFYGYYKTKLKWSTLCMINLWNSQQTLAQAPHFSGKNARLSSLPLCPASSWMLRRHPWAKMGHSASRLLNL